MLPPSYQSSKYYFTRTRTHASFPSFFRLAVQMGGFHKSTFCTLLEDLKLSQYNHTFNQTFAAAVCSIGFSNVLN